jgi:hypothetical protein
MRAARSTAWFVSLVILYMSFVVTATRDEALAAVVVALVVTLFLVRLERITECRARVPLVGWLELARRVPYAVVRESFDLLGPVLWRAVVRRERVAGRWIALRYESDANGARDGFGRRTLVVFGSNLTPNALPLCVDDERERIVLHQLVYRRESAADRPRYPI